MLWDDDTPNEVEHDWLVCVLTEDIVTLDSEVSPSDVGQDSDCVLVLCVLWLSQLQLSLTVCLLTASVRQLGLLCVWEVVASSVLCDIDVETDDSVWTVWQLSVLGLLQELNVLNPPVEGEVDGLVVVSAIVLLVMPSVDSVDIVLDTDSISSPVPHG